MPKIDRSPIVSQRDKVRDEFLLKPFPWTAKQLNFIKVSLEKNTKIIICKAPPGTGKTLCSLYCCLWLLSKKYVSEILYLRNPLESTAKSIGYLSGEKNAKMEPYGMPMFDHFKELLEKPDIDQLLKERRIQTDSIGFIKGRTFHATAIISDESEDLTLQEFRLLTNRLGKYSKLFIIGDEKQSNVKNNGFVELFNLFNNPESLQHGVVTLEFTSKDCMRNDIMKFILDKFDTII